MAKVFDIAWRYRRAQSFTIIEKKSYVRKEVRYMLSQVVEPSSCLNRSMKPAGFGDNTTLFRTNTVPRYFIFLYFYRIRENDV